MYGQICFQGFGLRLSQLLALVQCLLYSAEFAAVLWLLGPSGHPPPAVCLISACVLLPLCLCCVCCSIPLHCCLCE